MTGGSSVVVVDNGGGLLKAGFGGDKDPIAVVPNCMAKPPGGNTNSKKWLVADQLQAEDVDVTGMTLKRPIDRGYLINMEVQREVWERVLRSLLQVDPTNSSLLLVEPMFNPPALQHATDELVFEEFGFNSLCVADAPSLVHLYENFTLNYGVRRMDLGGKALTNYLKELISYRSLNVMDETLLIDDAKEKLCFVSLDVPGDLRLARSSSKDNPFRCSYILPDGITYKKGFVRDMDEALRYCSLPLDGKSYRKDHDMDTDKFEDRKKLELSQNEFVLTNERFLVPEMLFHPIDLGMNQAGLAECIVRAVQACHLYLQPVLFESIILTGGSTLFPRFTERLERELRPLVPDDYQVKIIRQENPLLGVWRGGSILASSPYFESMCVTKSEYEEMGSARCRRRFFH
ncbi:actin-related protein 6 isoform X2 [Phragmites australis]|uniref:actin-related protein 6 isoform X2 n=1 Tax=Phragmites australis TaxID=29695 RepID=UPI002D7742E8|nr:actin-related protein 6 isoform X2 [Phragmites australis]